MVTALNFALSLLVFFFCAIPIHMVQSPCEMISFLFVVVSFWSCFPGWEDVCHLCFEMNSGKYSRFLKRSLLPFEHDSAINMQVGRKLWRTCCVNYPRVQSSPRYSPASGSFPARHTTPPSRAWHRVPKEGNCVIRLFNSPTYFSCYQQLVTSAGWYASLSCKHSV